MADINIFLAFIDSSGDAQVINAGSDDNDSPIYYELETQELELGNRAFNKQIKDKISVISQNAHDSKIEIIPDDKDAIPINIDLGKRVSTATIPNIKAHYATLRWSGNTVAKAPILEGFHLNNITDDGIHG